MQAANVAKRENPQRQPPAERERQALTDLQRDRCRQPATDREAINYMWRPTQIISKTFGRTQPDGDSAIETERDSREREIDGETQIERQRDRNGGGERETASRRWRNV